MTRVAWPGSWSGRFDRLMRNRENETINTPSRSATASLADAPADGKKPRSSATSLAAPARSEAMDPTQMEWWRKNGWRVREAKEEKRRVREKQKRTWYNLSGASHGSLSSIPLEDSGTGNYICIKNKIQGKCKAGKKKKEKLRQIQDLILILFLGFVLFVKWNRNQN